MARNPTKEAIRPSARRTARQKAAEAPPPAHPEPVATNTVTTLPLFSLCLSGLNVRQTERDADIAALAEDIAARGLKQNLVVVPAHFMTAETDQNFGDKFEVVAGGRRYQALKLLAEAGRLPHDHPVPVMVDARTEARETSLSENLHRVAMNPADEFEAFAQIAAQQQHGPAGSGYSPESVAYVAKRFGVTQRHVEGRLRLASLAPEVLEALRAGTINLDSAKAYAGTEDHQLQVIIFAAQCKSSWKPHDPRTVRDALRGATVPLSDPRMLWVTAETYQAAGGRIETEMFMGTDGEQRAADVPLLDRLTRDKAEPLLPALAAADGWLSALFATGSHYNWKAKAPKDMIQHQSYSADPTPEEKLERIAVYVLDREGTALVASGHFKPKPAANPASPGYVPPTPEELAAQRRANGITDWAARLAVGPFAGTPLEGRSFWPDRGSGGWVSGLDYQKTKDGQPDGALVCVMIRVSQAEIDAARAAGEAKYDEELAEIAEREAARAAAAAADGDEPDIDDDDVQTENDDEFGED